MSIVNLTFRPLKVDIEFKNIEHKVPMPGKNIEDNVPMPDKKKKTILEKLSGKFVHGKLHAIMGPSGCGKSSLLNVLAGFNNIATGSISLNEPLTEKSLDTHLVRNWGNVITPVRSYILQDDFLVSELTVQEQMEYAVRCKVPGGVPAERRQKIITTILEKIGLKGLESRKLGVLSGGQKKRVSVASELVNYPPVIFLDEPTTGLDSNSTYELIDYLKSLALNGCNIIAVIHQPNSRVFRIFDTLTVLYSGGKLAYRGPTMALAETMERLLKKTVPVLENPAEILFEGRNIEQMAEESNQGKMEDTVKAATAMIKRKEGIYEFMRKPWSRIEGGDSGFEDEEHIADIDVEDNTILRDAHEVIQLCKQSLPSATSRFKTIFGRTIKQSQRDIVFMAGRLVAYIGTSILVAACFQFIGNDASKVLSNVAFLFIMLKIFTLGTCIVTIMNSQVHLDILIREHINSWYGVMVFYLSRTIIEAGMNIFLSIFFSMTMWLMTYQQSDILNSVFTVALLMCLHCIGIHHLSFILAMFVDRDSLPQLPFAMAMLQVVFCGYFVKLCELPVWIFWMQYINFGSFTYKGLVKLAYSKSVNGTEVSIPCHIGDQHPLCRRYKRGTDVLDYMCISADESPWIDVYALIGYAIVLALLGGGLMFLYVDRKTKAIARI